MKSNSFISYTKIASGKGSLSNKGYKPNCCKKFKELHIQHQYAGMQ